MVTKDYLKNLEIFNTQGRRIAEMAEQLKANSNDGVNKLETLHTTESRRRQMLKAKLEQALKLLEAIDKEF